jgi:hypothetical protein
LNPLAVAAPHHASEREEMPGIRIIGMPTPTLMGNGERPAVTIRTDPSSPIAEPFRQLQALPATTE